MKARRTLIAAIVVAIAMFGLQACASSTTNGGAAGGATGETAGCGDVAPTLASHTGTAPDGTGKTLQVMVAMNTYFPTQQKQWFADISAEFKQRTGADVSFVTYANPTDELKQINQSVVSSQGPDIYGLGTTFTPTACASSAFVTLNDTAWTTLGGKNQFIPATLAMSGPSDRAQIGVPMRSRPFVMAVNTDLLAKSGLPIPTTWDEFAKSAKAVTGDGVYGIAAPIGDSYVPWKLIWNMSVQLGNPLIDTAHNKAMLDQPAVAQAYKTFFSWYRNGLEDPAAVGWKSVDALAAFAAGKALFLPMVSGDVRVALEKSPVADHWKYALLPTIPPGTTSLPANGKAATSIVSGENWAVAKYSKNQDLAFDLLKVLLSENQQLAYFRTFGDLPVTNAAGAQVQGKVPTLAPLVDSANKSVGTAFSGAWGTNQTAIADAVVQLTPKLKDGSLTDADIAAQLATEQAKVQAALKQ